MKCHLKFFFILKILFFFTLNLSAQKLSNVIFKASQIILSPDNDGFNDEVTFEISLLQDKEIKVKDWNLKIYNYDYNLVRSFPLPSRLRNKNKFTIIWNGKDEVGNLVSAGIYEAILTLFYDYGNITKTQSLKIEVYFDNFFVNLTFENPYVILKWDPEKKVFSELLKEAEIRANYKNDFSIYSSFRSLILNHKKEVIEVREWEKKPKSKMLWNGKDRNKTVKTGIFHYLFSYKSYENQIYQFLLTGLTVIPFFPRISSYMEPFIINRKGVGFFNNELKNFELVIKSNTHNLKNLGSMYYQLYCFKENVFYSNWDFIFDGWESFSMTGIHRLIPRIPENQYCFILFFERSINEYKFSELFKHSIFSLIPIYIDTQKPIIELELAHEYIQPDISYEEKYAQTMKVQIRDNTFIRNVEINLYLKLHKERLLLQKWNFTPHQIQNDSPSFFKKIQWYGDTIDNIAIESLDEVLVEVLAYDFADNVSRVEKSFFIDIYFKEKENQYISNISLSKIFDFTTNQLHPKFDEHLKKIVQQYKNFGKKYFYIRVHSHNKGNDEDNLIKTEMIAKKIYLECIKKISEKNLFYRGMGELSPYVSDENNVLEEYRNNRVELIISDEFFNEEKELF